MHIVIDNISFCDNANETFMIGDLKSIELNGFEEGTCTVNGTHNTIKIPYCDLTITGGVTHFNLKAAHPYHMGEYIEIGIFDTKLNIRRCSPSLIDGWFAYRCKTFVPTF